MDIISAEDPSTSKFDSVMICLSVVTFLLLLFVLYLIRNVYKLVGFTDIPMLFQVTALFLSLSFLLVYSILSVIRDFID